MSISSFTNYKKQYADPVNEGIFDFFKSKKDKLSKEDASSSLGFFSTLSSLLGFKSKDSEKTGAKNPVEAAMDEVIKNAALGQETRMKALMDAKDKALAEKIKAKGVAQQNQLNIRNAKAVNAYKAFQSRMAADKEFWKNNKSALFGKKEMEAYYDKMDKDYLALQGTSMDKSAQKLKDLATRILIDENGNVRDAKERESFLNDPANKHLRDEYREAKKSIDEYNGNVSEVLSDDDIENILKDEYEKISNAYVLNSTVDDDIKNYEEVKDKLESVHNKIDKYDKYKKSKEDLDKKLKECDDKITELENDIENYKNETDENMLEDIALKLSKEYDELGLTPSDSDDEEAQKKKSEGLVNLLKKYGLPEEIGIQNNLDNISKTIKGAKDGSSSIDMETVKSKRKEYIESLNEQKSSLKNDKNNINDDITAFEEDNKTVIDEYNDLVRDKLKQSGKDIDDASAKEEAEMDLKTQYTGESYENTIHEYEDKLKKSKDRKANEEYQRQARIQNLKEANKRYEQSKSEDNILDDEMKSDVDVRLNDIGEFETVCVDRDDENYGKAGFYKKDENGKNVFIPRPKLGSSEDKLKEYHDLKLKSVNDIDLKSLKTIEITKDEDGKYHDEDGKELDKDQVVSIIANNKNNTQLKERVMDIRRQALKSYSDCCEDGKISDKEKFDKLPDEVKSSLSHIIDNYNDMKERLDKAENDEERDNIRKEYEDKLNDEFGDLNTGGKNPIETVIQDFDEYDDYEDDEENMSDDDEENEPDDDYDPRSDEKAKINPAKVWKRRKNKNTGKVTKNYYFVKGKNPEEKQWNITPQEYKERIRNYKERKSNKSDDEQTDNNSLMYHLFKNIKPINEHLRSL